MTSEPPSPDSSDSPWLEDAEFPQPDGVGPEEDDAQSAEAAAHVGPAPELPPAAEAQQIGMQVQAMMAEAMRRMRVLEDLKRQRHHMRRRFRLRQLKLTMELEQLQALSLSVNLSCRKDLLSLIARRNLIIARAMSRVQQGLPPRSPPPGAAGPSSTSS